MKSAPFELVVGTGPRYTDQRTVARIDRRGDALLLAEAYAAAHPMQDAFLFEWVSAKTRLLVNHSLNSHAAATRPAERSPA